MKAHALSDLVDTMKTALDEVYASDIAGWFKHCGYC